MTNEEEKIAQLIILRSELDRASTRLDEIRESPTRTQWECDVAERDFERDLEIMHGYMTEWSYEITDFIKKHFIIGEKV